MTMKAFGAAGLSLLLIGCQDKEAEALATTRCEALLAAQELASLPEQMRNDPRATIRPNGDPRTNDGKRITFVRRAYDRLTVAGDGERIEPREYTCKFDKMARKVATLSTNGHTMEIRDNDDEWAIKQKSGSIVSSL